MATKTSTLPGSFRGAVYGDLVGAPYMIENTYNRYFPLGESRRAFSHGKVRSFFPEVTEVSHGAAAVCNWLSTYRDAPTAEALQKCLRDQFLSHPRGGWTEPTRLFLSSGNGHPSETPDWSAITRTVPIASYVRDDLFRALDLAEACVMATCANEDTVMVAKALTHGIFMARHGAISAEVFTTLEMQYGLHLTRIDDELRAELRGEVRQPLEMMGTPVEGAYRYVLPASPAPPSARLVTEAAVRAVVQSDSWEDAVRRAVSYGGPSNAVAGIAGALAESLYGEVSPTVIGKLFPYIPTDIVRQIESFDHVESIAIEGKASPYAGLSRNAVTVLQVGSGSPTVVVPEDRGEIHAALRKHYPGIQVVAPSELGSITSRYKEIRNGTFPYGSVPELSTYYVQDGKLVSPSQYVAPGMPPLQERKRHLREFNRLRNWCIDVQKELNAAAGNPGAGQIHYGDAFHLWIGSRRIDFFYGDSLAGRISLTEKGLLKVDLGDYRDLSTDSRFENHREQAWASRSVFNIAESANPIAYLDEIRSDIRARLLDEGMGSGTEAELDSRYLGEDERLERSPVSNIDHLEALESGEDMGLQPLPTGHSPFPEDLQEGKTQEVRTVYSIGYGMRSQEGFINTLNMVCADTVIDIRSTPKSRLAPQFDADTIYEALQAKGIDYYLAGDRLGGRPEDLSLYSPSGRVDWDALREDTSFKEGIAAIEKLASEGHVVAVVCAEGDPLFCHRFGTVSRTLSEDGMQVRHVLTNGETLSHAELEARLVSKYESKGVLRSAISGSYSEQLTEAYNLLNDERGFKMKSHRRRIPKATRVRF